MKKLIILAIFICSVSYCISQKTEKELLDSLLSEIPKTKDDSQKVRIYIKIISVQIDYKPEEGLKYEKPATELAEKLQWEEGKAKIKANTGRLNWRMGNFSLALKQHFDALKIYAAKGNKKAIALTLVYIGQDYADGGNYPEALIWFSKALEEYKAQNNKESIGNLWFLFAWVYTQQGNYYESAKANIKALKVYEELKDDYSVAIALGNIGEDYIKLENYPSAISYIKRSLVVLEKSGDKINTAGVYIGLGEAYLRSGNFGNALNNYNIALKLAESINNPFMEGLALNNIGNAWLLKNNFTEAVKNYLLAEGKYKSVSNRLELASLYSSIGLCFTRLKRYPEAQKYFAEAYALSKELDSKKSIGDYYKGKEVYDSANGRWHDAYFNYKRYISFKDSSLNFESAKKIVATQMQYESEKKEAIARAEQEKKDALTQAEIRKQKIIRNAVVGGLVVVALFLLVVYRQRNKISMARKRSDELLLNILPSEVAEELKEKGSADAKQFNDVTVMFTDFKDFTQIAEKLSPTELVNEIHTCFKAFDTIIGKYPIEKIKTIGDSYMCAGGLPVACKTHAEDVVNAALEIISFMSSRNSVSTSRNGGPKFEIRIGIHTGPVVAGIVGVKKFAYDIWGDTVNIASRMESSGEAGKVNISGSTFLLVKEKFNCTHRGKIAAKNKGDIDMYFVDTST